MAQQLPLDATDLGAFERQIVHQPLLIEDEPDHRTTDAVGVDLPAGLRRAAVTVCVSVNVLALGSGL
jgi:hypothetical protein